MSFAHPHLAGGFLADSGTDPPKLLARAGHRPSLFVLRSMRKDPRDFWRDISVNHVEPDAR